MRGVGQQRDDLLAVAGLLAALDDDVIAVAQMVLDHRIAADFEDVDAVFGVEQLFHVELFTVFDGFDG